MAAKSVLVLMRTQGLRSGARMPPLVPSLLRHCWSGTGRLDLSREEKKIDKPWDRSHWNCL